MKPLSRFGGSSAGPGNGRHRHRGSARPDPRGNHFRVAFDFGRVSFQRVPERFQFVRAGLQFVGAAVLLAGKLMLLVGDMKLSFGDVEAVCRFFDELIGRFVHQYFFRTHCDRLQNLSWGNADSGRLKLDAVR
jgi:hypothetical protein